MKYCKTCRLLAGAAEEKCRRCGKPVVELGASGKPTAAASHEPALEIQGKMQELAAQEQRNLRHVRVLLGLCIGVVCAIFLTAYQVYSHRVLSYAILEDVIIQQDDFEPNRVRVQFNVVRPGKVAFNRASGAHRTEKIDVFSESGPVTLSWAWPSPEKIDFSVNYRTGFFKAEQEESFAIKDRGRSLDIVFLIDTTQSMRPFIDALKSKCTDFADVVKQEGHDCRLGFVSFGDLEINEPIQVFQPTADVLAFKQEVGNLDVTGGGDEPESSVEALRRALSIKFRKNARPCLVHVTDATCHNAQELPELARRLKENSMITYVVSLKENTNLYSRLCSNGGIFLPMEDAEFDGILDYVARSLVSEIRYQERTI